jgi:hypothetical protein
MADFIVTVIVPVRYLLSVLQAKSTSALMQVPLPSIILWLLIDHLSFFTTGRRP